MRDETGTIKDPAAKTEPEVKAPEAKAPETKAPEKKDEPKAPEAYADFTAPEGYELNADLVAKFTPIARELGLDQAGAQRLVDFYGEASLAAVEAPYKAYETMRNGWRDEVSKSDLGDGKGNLRPEVSTKIAAVLDSLPNAAKVREALDLTGAGDHPEVIRAFVALAEGLTEGHLVTGANPSPLGQRRPGSSPRSAAQALYPNLKSSAT